MDTNEVLFGILHGNFRNTTMKFSVDLPKKRGCGGSRAIRFARIRKEKRQNYVRKVSQTAVQCFITDDKVNVDGIILASVAEFSSALHQADVFDPVSCSFPFIIITNTEILQCIFWLCYLLAAIRISTAHNDLSFVMDDKLYREVSVFITFDINEEPINNFSKIFENAKDIDRSSLITVLIQRASYYYREIMYKG
ncbi:unnamed protein product [Rotaria sp. Silwood2]|nr:unnamed protein product [Rotaria sp. Silwood2]